MPKITLDVPSTDVTITRRVVLDIVYDLIGAMGIDYNVNILYPGSTDPEDLPIKTNNPKKSPTNDMTMKVLLEVEEEYVGDNVPTTVMKSNETSPIFKDSAIGVNINPIYAQSELTITMKWRMPSRAASNKFISDIRRHGSLFRSGLFHEVNYTYLLPEVATVILTEIHRCRESSSGYGDPLTTYLIDHFDDQIELTSNLNKSHRAWSKRERQTKILGTYDFEVVPENPEDSESKSKSIVSFTYKIRYDKVLSLMMTYPILVHNKPISSKMYDRSMPFELGHRLQMPSKTQWNMDVFTSNQYVTGFPMGAPIPGFLDWLPESVPSDLEGLLRVMIQVQEDSPRELLNLSMLGNLSLEPWVLQRLRSGEYTKINKLKQSEYFIALFEDDKMLDHTHIEVDADLNVTATFDMNIRKQYRVWFACMTDLRFLEDGSKSSMLSDGLNALKYIKGLDPTVDRNVDTSVNSDGSLPLRTWNKMVNQLTTRKVPIRGEGRLVNFRIGHYVIEI